MKSRFLVLFCFFLSFCSEEETLPPAFIEGVVRGVLTDGTAVEESFRYEYSSTDFDQFRKTTNNVSILTLMRWESGSGDSPFIRFTLMLPNSSDPMDSLQFHREGRLLADAFEIFHKKQLTSVSLMEIYASGFQTIEQGRLISIAANQNYKFVTDEFNNPLFKVTKVKQTPGSLCCPSNHCCTEGISPLVTYKFWNVAGDTISFGGIGAEDFENDKDLPFLKIRYANGTESGHSDLYQKLAFNLHHTFDSFVEISPTRKSLFELYDARGETGDISNITYDEQTGRLVFDFLVKLNGQNSTNSTGHALEISGKFDSGKAKVYREIVK